MTAWTNYSWAAYMLSVADPPFPVDTTNVDNVARWMCAEEPDTDWWDRNNPLNASLGTNSVDGTGSYPSLTVGAEYTARMLRQQNMSAIADVLDASGPIATFSAGAAASPWSTGYHGKPGYIASIPQPPVIAAPATAPPTPTPTPPKPAPPPPPPNLLEVIMGSPVTTPGFAARYLYRFCLFREIDSGGYSACLALLNGGGTLTQLLAAIQDSPEGQTATAAFRDTLNWSAASASASTSASVTVEQTGPPPDTSPTGTAAFIRSRIPSSRD